MEDTAWDSPWGRGRPGWHIECSAMAEATLGAPFEIHGGGNDLIFPHHENEAAQTLAARGQPLAQIWMHNGMLQLGAEKMAKSVGNIRGLGDVLDDVGPRHADLVLLRGPLPPAAGVLARAARGRGAARRADPRRRAAARAGRLAGGAGARTATRSSTRWRTTSTRRARWRRWPTGSARPTAPTGRSATRTCARCSACSGSRTCSSATRGRRPRSSRWPSAAQRRARRATSPRPTACATSCARAAGRSRRPARARAAAAPS